MPNDLQMARDAITESLFRLQEMQVSVSYVMGDSRRNYADRPVTKEQLESIEVAAIKAIGGVCELQKDIEQTIELAEETGFKRGYDTGFVAATPRGGTRGGDDAQAAIDAGKRVVTYDEAADLGWGIKGLLEQGKSATDILEWIYNGRWPNDRDGLLQRQSAEGAE